MPIIGLNTDGLSEQAKAVLDEWLAEASPPQPVTVEDHGTYLTITFPDVEGGE